MIDKKSYTLNSKAVYQEGKKIAWKLSTNPSSSELLFKSILDDKHIKYKFQKLFFKSIPGTKKCADSYYIAQFWLPRKKLIISIGTDNSKFIPADFRIYDALEAFPKAQCVKLSEYDLHNTEFIDKFIQLLK